MAMKCVKKYMILSYCWGDTAGGQSDNEVDRQSSISFKKLTPTFWDVVQITSRFDIRYLWIDTICIIQDSTED
jgi:Heterokaryon incompatibility protein (HET)